MKKITTLLTVLLPLLLNAAPIFNAPTYRIQPNGDTLHCLLSGDEFYHRLHDKNGFTIVQNPETGYWVYADTIHTEAGHWNLVPSSLIAGTVDPQSAGLSPNLSVDDDTWTRLQHRYDIPKQYQTPSPKTSGRNHGTLNNIVIFIRFSDETEISTPFDTINAMFNDSSATSNSMYRYFREASYGKINIPTHYFPAPNAGSIISFQDSMPRSYYEPYNATSAPNGYTDDDERRIREFNLLERAVNYINAHHPVPSSLNLDMDNDGKIDNICFIVKGTYTGWSDLLWPHKWSLYDRNVYINGKRVYTFNLQLEGSGSHYFSSSTFCHEMFHSLGAPDLYRYNVRTSVSGVGSWDLMCSNSTPPQHMSAYMKWKYGNWLDSIPEITIPGTYSLHSLADTDYSNCAYKIAAQEPHQWYVLEYRDNTEHFETALPGKGLIIFRIDDRFNGNASYDGVDYFDEVYLFRPGAANDSTNGYTSRAHFSNTVHRTAFTPTTDPHPWLTGNVIDTTFAILDVSTPGTTISFTYSDLRGCRIPMDLRASNVTGNSASLSWTGNAPSYRLEWKVAGSNTINSTTVQGTSYQLTGLALNTQYLWRLRGLCSTADSSDASSWHSLNTLSCTTPSTVTIGSRDTSYYTLPVNNYYRYTYSQMIYTPSEVGGAMSINSIAFNYVGNNSVTSKDNCVVYLAHRNDSTFAGSAMSHMVPLSQLTKVYEGPFNFSYGWNLLELDTVFNYDGIRNLVVAVDDNSNDYDGTSYRYACTNTGNNYTSLTCYSDNTNIDPGDSQTSASNARRQYRPDIRLGGCLASQNQYYTVTVVNANPAQGTVSGDSTYEENTTATLTAYPAPHCHFSYWQLPNGTRTTDNPYSFTVTANITVTAHFATDTHSLSLVAMGNGEVTGSGNYPYGTVVTLAATPAPHNHFLHWQCSSTGLTYPTPSISITLTSDSSFAALFAEDRHFVQVRCDTATYGSAWFTLPGDETQSVQDSVTYGTQVMLHALPNPSDGSNIYTFNGWDDGDTTSPRLVTVTGDTLFTAHFSHTTSTIAISSVTAEGIGIHSHGNSITITGAEGHTVEILDITGRQLFHSSIHHSPFTIHNQKLSSGVYLVKVSGIPPHKVVILN